MSDGVSADNRVTNVLAREFRQNNILEVGVKVHSLPAGQVGPPRRTTSPAICLPASWRAKNRDLRLPSLRMNGRSHHATCDAAPRPVALATLTAVHPLYLGPLQSAMLRARLSRRNRKNRKAWQKPQLFAGDADPLP